jgi:4-hydroxy-tetrahydrodipicolinate reductase
VVLEGEHDRIELVHRARGREGFAAGAVEAAEWIPGRRGVFTVEEMLRDLLQATGGESDG